VWAREGTLRELAGSDPEISAKVSAAELDDIFNLGRYLENIGLVYNRLGL
jgi:hypothetical protein